MLPSDHNTAGLGARQGDVARKVADDDGDLVSVAAHELSAEMDHYAALIHARTAARIASERLR